MGATSHSISVVYQVGAFFFVIEHEMTQEVDKNNIEGRGIIFNSSPFLVRKKIDNQVS